MGKEKHSNLKMVRIFELGKNFTLNKFILWSKEESVEIFGHRKIEKTKKHMKGRKRAPGQNKELGESF